MAKRKGVSKRGFSLLEVLVVVVIISLLAVFGHAAYVGYVERSKITEAFNVLEDYKAIAMQLRAQSGSISPYYVLFTDTNTTGIVSGSPSSSTAEKQVNLTYVNNIVAIAGTDDDNNYILLGAQMQDDGYFVSGSDFVYIAGLVSPTGVMTWECGISTSQANTISTDYLPATCQARLP